MRRILVMIAISSLLAPANAFASLDGKEDFSEPRVVAVSLDSSIGSTPWANASGYLYSSRIVFSAGHLKDNAEFSQLYVSQPNIKLTSGMEPIKVIKKYFPDTYKTKIFKDDFAILVLEKPLGDVKPANLITPELLSNAIATKTPMKQLGFGAYQDICLLKKVKAPCQFGNEFTSLVPRSVEMTPWSATGIKEKYGPYNPEIADHLFLTSAYKGGPCGGDSGGPTTVSLDGKNYYVATVATGFWNAYACGQSDGVVGDSLGYTAPVYKFLDLIAEAEKYVADHPYSPAKANSKTTMKASPSAAPTKPSIAVQYQYIYKIAQQWAKKSKASDSAIRQCTSARDKGLVILNGKPTPISGANLNLARDLRRYPGFNACLAAFLK